ncbi:hypothetical protein ACFE04_013826 [Oxalis oulophora]
MSTSSKKIVLRSCDGETFVVDEASIIQSLTIKNMMKDVVGFAEDVIPVPNVNSKILSKVIEYCNKHAAESDHDASKAEDIKIADEIKAWDTEFVNLDQNTLFELIQQPGLLASCLFVMELSFLSAANYLNIQSLIELTCSKVAEMMKGKTPEELRTLFNIENDYTPEEEAEVRRENQWAFQ